MKVDFKHFHMNLKNVIRLALFIHSTISVTGSDVYRACGGEGYDGQDVFCTTGPYFHVQMQKMFFKICYLPNYTSIRDVGATETCATILPMTLSSSLTRPQPGFRFCGCSCGLGCCGCSCCGCGCCGCGCCGCGFLSHDHNQSNQCNQCEDNNH